MRLRLHRIVFRWIVAPHAKAEIADVEQTSREALAEVRNTIRGYRAFSLEAEMKQATAALETAGVRHQLQVAGVPVGREIPEGSFRRDVSSSPRHGWP